MVKSSKANQIKRNKKIKKSVKNKRGGSASLYGVAQMAQSRGCARYQGVRNPDPTSSFDTCECIDRNNTKIDEFEFPKGVFTCSPTEGLKLVESTANPLYRTYKQLEEQVFFTKSTDFPLLVEKEFQELLEKNKTVAQEAARFLIDYTLDSREHRDRVFYDTLIPENIQTLMNNVQAILENIALVANNPNLKFNDITSLLGKLVDKLQKQYIQLRELEKSHGKLLEKMELLKRTEGETETETQPEVKIIDAGQVQKTDYSSGASSSGLDEYEKIIAKQIAILFGKSSLSGVVGPEKQFADDVMNKLPPILGRQYTMPNQLLAKIRGEDKFIARKIVELLFEKDLSIVKNLSLESLTKFMRAWLKYFMRHILRVDSTPAELYTVQFLISSQIKTAADWASNANTLIQHERKTSAELSNKSNMHILAAALYKYLTNTITV